jgi:hypothetical protein
LLISSLRTRGHVGISMRATARPTLDLDPDREIVPIDIERDLDSLRVQVRAGRIVKARNLATHQDEPPHRLSIVRPAVQPISEMDSADLVPIGALAGVVAHRDERDLIG